MNFKEYLFNFLFLIFSPFTYSMIERETNAIVGTFDVEDYFESGITYCRIDEENIASR